jgi:hypothetical protein
MIEVRRTDFSGVCHGATFKDCEGNGLALHHRYKPYES